MNDVIISYIRTGVPLLVGALISWGVLPASATDQAAVAITAVVTAAYYGLVRLLETRWPSFGWFLGKPKAPTYTPPA
jgi:hypothetical protein